MKIIEQLELEVPTKRKFMTNVATIKLEDNTIIKLEFEPTWLAETDTESEKIITNWKNIFSDFPYIIKTKSGIYKVTEKNFYSIIFSCYNSLR